MSINIYFEHYYIITITWYSDSLDQSKPDLLESDSLDQSKSDLLESDSDYEII